MPLNGIIFLIPLSRDLAHITMVPKTNGSFGIGHWKGETNLVLEHFKTHLRTFSLSPGVAVIVGKAGLGDLSFFSVFFKNLNPLPFNLW